jgi:UDP-N-acetylglucosamine transferase subunit ALG13
VLSERYIRGKCDVSTFISVGTCHQSLNRMLSELASMAARDMLPTPVYVQHGHTPFESPHCTATAFMNRDEFEIRLAEAELVIVHGGATVLQAIRAGKVPIVMPRRASHGEHFDDHQVAFARSLENRGQAVVAYEANDLAECVQKALVAQRDGVRRPAVTEAPPLLNLIRQTLADWSRELDSHGTRRSSTRTHTSRV